jgi:aminomethyltransferase
MVAGLFDHDPSALKYYYGTATRCRGNQCVVSRTGYTGEDGLEVMIAAEHVTPLCDELMSRGAVPCGLGARDTLRLEAAMPLYGHELTEETDPYQAGLGWAVKPAKGDFVGRDAMLKRKDDPGRSRRVGVVLNGSRSAREGCKVLSSGREVGIVTSGAPSPTLGKPIAMAYVEPAASSSGTALEIDIRGQRAAAQVVPLPFYQRKK